MDDMREQLVEQWSDPDTKVAVKDVKAALPAPDKKPERSKIEQAAKYIINHADELNPDLAKGMWMALSAQFNLK